ncbi:PapD-like protein [Naematelia encephala]|uniref:PapD-like protein n=1 Tax=Naematelia encephala TaxID=71784 RepID=A0A1Y2BAV1_9TREE|nr:PapD-like protein [Naematelia encephala]
MSVELSPAHQLGFPRPLTTLVKRSLLIHNPHSQPVAFKVKTTAPKQYCVRPNSGRVESGESVEVQVLLQPLPADPPPHAKCKDKFLVQSAFISPDEEMRTLAEMWAETERTNKSAIQEQKIKCAYLAAEDGSTGANGIPEEEESRIEESQVFAAAHSSPIGTTNGDKLPTPISASAPAPAISLGGLGAVSPAVPVAAREVPSNANEPSLPALSAADIQNVNPTNAALVQGLDATTSDSDKLSAALAEIERLRAQLAEAQGPSVTGLRKRGGAAPGASGPQVAVEKAKEVVHSADGISPPIVAGLLFAVFALTYLFF